jgi:phytoene/squalene synthetase
MSLAQHPASPEPGSHRYYTLLYTPSALREELNTLLALADEIGTTPTGNADHSVAHVRLEWWRREVERFAQGKPQHPWLQGLLAQYPATGALNLRSLVDGAEVDLAAQTLRSQHGAALRHALFAVIADALCDEPLTPEWEQAVGVLGEAVQRLERDPLDRMVRAQMREPLQIIGAALQPPLTPLLVWLALAARPARRRHRLIEQFADNVVAWSAARRAARGRFDLVQ